MIKLTKTKSTEWNGNGFGTSAAEWVVKGQEHIVVHKFLSDWIAYDNNTGKRICRGYTKRDCLEALQEVFDVPASNKVKLGFGL